MKCPHNNPGCEVWKNRCKQCVEDQSEAFWEASKNLPDTPMIKPDDGKND